jgi:hypothetical protein
MTPQIKYPAPASPTITAWSSPDVMGDVYLRILVPELVAAGCKVTHSTEYLRLQAAQVPALAARSKEFLEMTPDEFTDLATSAAVLAETRHAINSRLNLQKQELDVAMSASMRAEVNTYLDTLRPAFDEAAYAARALRDQGVQPTSTADELIQLDPKIAAAWVAFKNSNHGATLRRIANLRAGLARALNLEDGDYAAGITKPVIPDLLDRKYAAATSHQIWLEAAPVLTLRPFDID